MGKLAATSTAPCGLGCRRARFWPLAGQRTAQIRPCNRSAVPRHAQVRNCIPRRMRLHPRAFHLCSGAHGCDRHPAFPASSVQERAKQDARLGQSCRENANAWPPDRATTSVSSWRKPGAITTDGYLERRWNDESRSRHRPRSMGPCFRRDDARKKPRHLKNRRLWNTGSPACACAGDDTEDAV